MTQNNSDNSSLNPYALDRRSVRRRFDSAATSFDGADFVHRTTAQGMLQRLQPMTLQPSIILDLGSATGSASQSLSSQYKKARVVSIDSSMNMLRVGREKHRWFSRVREVQADAARLPLADASVDIVFANMLLPWIDDAPALFAEVARVVRKDGVFMFSTLGPDSLLELRAAWSRVDDGEHVHRFVDMHNIGDAVMRSGLSDPVLDVDTLAVTWPDSDALFADLTAAGARNSLQQRRQSLSGKSRQAALREQLRAAGRDKVIHMSLELVYGHAFGRGARASAAEVYLSPQQIGRRAR